MASMRRLLVPLMVVASLLAACGSSGSSTKARPTTSAQMRIESPSPNQVTGPNVTVSIAITGARVVPAANTKGPLRGDEGHIHLSVDGKLVVMGYTTTQDLPGLTPGTHTLQAEFVAIDHQPFANRLIVPVIFQVK
jgi:hypothetical protein